MGAGGSVVYSHREIDQGYDIYDSDSDNEAIDPLEGIGTEVIESYSFHCVPIETRSARHEQKKKKELLSKRYDSYAPSKNNNNNKIINIDNNDNINNDNNSNKIITIDNNNRVFNFNDDSDDSNNNIKKITTIHTTKSEIKLHASHNNNNSNIKNNSISGLLKTKGPIAKNRKVNFIYTLGPGNPSVFSSVAT